MHEIKAVSLDEAGSIVTVQWAQQETISRYHAFWLRDNSPDPQTRDQHNGQRLITISDVPESTVASRATLVDNQTVEVTFSPGELHTQFDAGWLFRHRYDTAPLAGSAWVPGYMQTWNADYQPQYSMMDLQQIRDDKAALQHWLSSVHTNGVALLANGPAQSGALEQVINTFGFIRETNYGKWFDVRAEVNPENLAYTGLGLQAHTDNPYRDPVPTMQLLYCIENSAEGGENQVVDGFHAALRLQQEHPASFELLTRYPARFSYQGAGDVSLQSKQPMIELARDGEIRSIRFNSRSIAALTDVPFDDMPAYYDAYRRFSAIIDDPSMKCSFKLEPGMCFLLDNRRVLHARNGYTGSGNRWLQGCYADIDGLQSTLATLQRKAS